MTDVLAVLQTALADRYRMERLALILTQVGDAGTALDEIERLLSGPSLTSVHTLPLDPRWDPIRDQPRFKALLVKYAVAAPRRP